MSDRISFHRPPSVQRTLDALDGWHRRDTSPLTPAMAHQIAAVMEAAVHALRCDVLPMKQWRRNRHHAAACFQALEGLRAHPAFIGHNNPPQVDINFR